MPGRMSEEEKTIRMLCRSKDKRVSRRALIDYNRLSMEMEDHKMGYRVCAMIEKTQEQLGLFKESDG